MDDIENLLNNLNGMEPVSKQFREKLTRLLPEITKNDGDVFLRPGKLATKAWNLVSGFIVVLGDNPPGNPVVIDIYSPGHIVTDLLSFFHKTPVVYKFVAVGEVRVLELTQTDFETLASFPETAKLVQYITFLDIKKNNVKQELFLLPAKARMILFFKEYNVPGLPDKYCASLLRIELDKYIKLKNILLKSGQVDPVAGMPRYNSYGMQLAYEVKSYLMENYTQPDIDDTVKIAAQFNTTKKTLTRHFKKNLGVTVHQLILKLRLEKANELLATHKVAVKEVCTQVGFKDVYNFSRIFKKHFGFSAKTAGTKTSS